jgi:hypothetical protein
MRVFSSLHQRDKRLLVVIQMTWAFVFLALAPGAVAHGRVEHHRRHRHVGTRHENPYHDARAHKASTSPNEIVGTLCFSRELEEEAEVCIPLTARELAELENPQLETEELRQAESEAGHETASEAAEETSEVTT